MARRKLGIWIIGARGGVAATVCVGLAALKKGLAENQGLVSKLPQFSALEFADFADFTIGGHEIRQTTLESAAQKLVANNHALSGELVAKVKPELDKIDKNIRPGTLFNVVPAIEQFAGNEVRSAAKKESPRAAIERAAGDIADFQKRNELAEVVVVNLASTEPPVEDASLPTKWKDLAKLLE